MKRIFLFLGSICLLCHLYVHAIFDCSPIRYQFIADPIDVIIPTTGKDEIVLSRCIEGIKKNCQNIRRIIVVSDKPLTDEAEWFDEKNYPFSKFDVALYLNQLDYDRALAYQNHPNSRLGWYYQQLLKLYAAFVIPGISSNVLIVDSDVVFYRPVQFIKANGGGNYATYMGHYHVPYFQHADKLLPGLKKLDPNNSGIVHHMLFQKPVLDDLFKQVESHHKMEFWKAFCTHVNVTVDPGHPDFSGASEYEIYFNFVFARTGQVSIRPLRWKDSGDLHSVPMYLRSKYHFIAYHSYMRSL